jgi:hypothetical protein
MSKQQIHIRIENSVYILLKSKNVNVSSLVNELLKSYIDTEELDVPEESEIQKQLEKKTKIYKETQDEINILSVMLAKSREERKQREKEEAEAREDAHDLAIQMSREQELRKYNKGFN